MHAHGGQVYVDGANLNALVGLAAPGEFGADVSHLNLHKTFCIPHGGGGPGVGPVAVGAHLARFLPGHRMLAAAPKRRPSISAPVSAAPYGSASILPISWMYIAMMGGDGLRAATESAILAANYIARRLAPHYPVLYSGPDGLVAHECILDLRPLKETSDVSVDDVAKRLMDYGFHAPTMSFPVAGTLMIEPTESESKAELDRFVDAMIAIREEIRAHRGGPDGPRRQPAEERAAHRGGVAEHADWNAPLQPRAGGVSGGRRCKASKYWPPVGRADNVYGDRNLFCSCVPDRGTTRRSPHEGSRPRRRRHRHDRPPGFCASAGTRSPSSSGRAPPRWRRRSPTAARSRCRTSSRGRIPGAPLKILSWLGAAGRAAAVPAAARPRSNGAGACSS